MSERLYYQNAYTAQFTATITERLAHNGSPAVVLDATYFYPASGGQPPDHGMLADAPVLDVFVREDDGAVVHVLESAPADGDTVQGVIDWGRRFDHMQHHTGQHILTRAFIDAAGAPTVSFHLGGDAATIDVDRADLDAATLHAVEELANAIVVKNLEVNAWFPTAAEIARLPLRKTPEIDGSLRVVGIGSFDYTACGGTHVNITGEIGLIKIVRTEAYKGMTRITFLCGTRALHDYRHKNAIVHGLAADLTVGFWEVREAVARLREEGKAARAALRTARQRLLEIDAAELFENTPPVDGAPEGVRVVLRAFAPDELDAGELRALASRLVENDGTVALLGLAGEKATIIAARSADLDGPDMVPHLHAVMAALAGDEGARRGGGRPDFAQGGGVAVNTPALKSALHAAAESIRAALTE